MWGMPLKSDPEPPELYEEGTGPLAQRLRAERARAYGLPRHGRCYLCSAVGEAYRLGAVWLCGECRDRVEAKVDLVLGKGGEL